MSGGKKGKESSDPNWVWEKLFYECLGKSLGRHSPNITGKI